MKCQNGLLRNEQDSTICVRPMSKDRKLPLAEYLPLLILGILIICLFIACI